MQLLLVLSCSCKYSHFCCLCIPRYPVAMTLMQMTYYFNDLHATRSSKEEKCECGIFFFPIMKSNHHAYSIKYTCSMSTPMLSCMRQKKKESLNKSYVTVRTLANKRGIPWNSYNYAQPEAQQKTETQPVCAQAFHDNNKLVGFTSHLLFTLFDGV